MRISLLLVTLFCGGCADGVPSYEARSIADHGGLSPSVRLLRDATPTDAEEFFDPDESTRIIDARPIIDAVVDATPPPPVCPRQGLRESCDIPALQGPCAVGERICNVTSWSECLPVAFPRQERCDALDNDCDGSINESPSSQNGVLSRSCYTGAPGTDKEGPCRSGVSLCRATEEATLEGPVMVYSYGDCENEVVPAEEECDTLDNDCDASIDEGVLNACDECGHVPDEICDGVDNDCNGVIDEGLLNACGACGEVPRELCDFVDNDCDGQIDEDFLEGDCNCEHPDYVPQPEVCNGVDDDCDLSVDEGPFGGPLTKLCSTDFLTGEVITYDRREDGPQYVGGECRLGISFCELGRNANGEMQRGFYECVQEVRPGIERCNGVDDDCDGNVDEDFEQGRVAVMMVVDVSGSMEQAELRAAFTATSDSVQRLFNDGVVDVCYMLAVVGNDEMPDPYLFYPGDDCVPGVEDPPQVPIEDMSNAINTLRANIQAGNINQGGSSENTLDAIGKFFTDDLIDWDQDGVPENILWSTSRPQARLQGIEDVWEVDLSQYTHRIVIVLGDEPAQGAEWSNHDAARAMAHSGGMVFIIGTRSNARSYQPLLDFGAVHSEGLDGFGAQNAQQIADAVTEAIDEAACINARQEEEEEEEEEMACYDKPYEYYDNFFRFYDYKLASYFYKEQNICL